MPLEVLLIVLFSAACHAGWNLVAKSGFGDALSRSAAILIGAGITGLPFLLVTGLPDHRSIGFAAGSALIHVGYMALIGVVYRTADLSTAYPIMRGSSLILTALLASLLLGEILPPLAWLGVSIVAIGVAAMAAESLMRKGVDQGTLAAALLAAASVTAYTLVDGTGVRLSGDPVAYVLTMSALMGLGMLPVAVLFRDRVLVHATWDGCRRGLAGGALFNLSYAAALWAMTKAPIGLVGAARETSILFGAVLATLVLKEKFGRWRWAAAAVVVTGLALTRIARD